jgi:putative peptidoglycan lipid II flippase
MTATRLLIKHTAVTGAMTLLSRVSGLVRDIVFARLIGASAFPGADAFYVAFRIPNFFRRLFGEGAFSQAFVPVFAEYRARRDTDAQRAFLDHMTGVLAAVLFLITALGVIAAPWVVAALAPGFLRQAEKFALTVELLRLTFPYLFFISLVALAAGILNTCGRFGAAAFTPVLLNLCLIAAALWLAPYFAEPVVALAWGVLIAGVVQLGFQLPFLARLGLLPRPRLRGGDAEGVRRVVRLMLPALFGVSIAQINMLVNTLLASFLVTGSVSWLYYADRLMEFPLGVFGIAIATVILPQLSTQHANGAHEDFSRLLDWALRWVWLIGLPATVGLVVLAEPILVTLFYYGAFSAYDVRMSAQALAAFALGLPGFILVKVLAPGFYARQDTRTPVRIGAAAMGVNIVLSLLFIRPFAHTGLALAISAAAWVNAAWLYLRLRRLGVYRPSAGWARFLIKIGASCGVLAALLLWGAGESQLWLAATVWERLGRLTFWVVAGIMVYIGSVFAFGVRPAELTLPRR